MAGLIICPKCRHQFEPGEAFKQEVQKELNIKAKEWQVKKEEEYKQKEVVIQQQLQAKNEEMNKKFAEEKQKLHEELETSIQKTVSADYENRLNLLQRSAIENAEKLKEARLRE